MSEYQYVETIPYRRLCCSFMFVPDGNGAGKNVLKAEIFSSVMLATGFDSVSPHCNFLGKLSPNTACVLSRGRRSPDHVGFSTALPGWAKNHFEVAEVRYKIHLLSSWGTGMGSNRVLCNLVSSVTHVLGTGTTVASLADSL